MHASRQRMLCTFRKCDCARVSPSIVGHGCSMDEDRSKRRNNPREISDDARLLASVVEIEPQAKQPNLRNVMAKQIRFGTTAKLFHWADCGASYCAASARSGAARRPRRRHHSLSDPRAAGWSHQQHADISVAARRPQHL
jgi:hypothetical protein